MCTHASSRVKRKSFYRNSEFQMVLCWFPVAIFVYHNCTQVWRLHTKVCKGAWNVSANNSETVGHKDLRLGQIVYILVFYNISFSWLLPLDAFQFIFFRRVYCVTVKPIYWIVSSSSFASNVFQKLLAKIHISTKVFQDFLTFISEALKLIISRLSIDDNKSTSWLTPFNYF